MIIAILSQEYKMKLTFGQIKFFAHQYMMGHCIPIFTENKINREINKHINRIRKRKTRRKKYEIARQR